MSEEDVELPHDNGTSLSEFVEPSNESNIEEGMVNGISRPERTFLKKIMKKASTARTEHLKYARRYKALDNLFGTLGQILSVLAGSAGLGSLLALKPSDPGFAMLLTISLVSLGAALVSTLKQSLGYGSKASTKKNTASDYFSVITKTSQFLSTPGADRKDVEIFTHSIVLEMNVIDAEQEI